MPQNLIELSAKYKGFITSHMLVFYKISFIVLLGTINIPFLHQPGTVSGAYSSLSTDVIGIPGLWNSLSCDLYTESTFMWYAHSPMGTLSTSLQP